MRLQKNKPSASLLVIMIIFSSLIIAYGIFRILAFQPVMFFDDTVKQIFGNTSMIISRNTQNVKKGFLSFLKSPQLQKEIDRLQYEIRLNKVELARSPNLVEENKQLKLFLGLLTEKDYKFIPCDIWFRDPDNPMNFTINKGKKDQLKKEQGIVYPLELKDQKIIQYQLIGRIQELNQHTSRVLSILDHRSKISCRNQRTLALGNVMYDEKKKELYVITLNENDDYAVNDIIVTSDLSSLPKNLIIGIVQRIEATTSINKKIFLGTSIDFMKITVATGIQ
jgi:rod shape-determining protein MreC